MEEHKLAKVTRIRENKGSRFKSAAKKNEIEELQLRNGKTCS